MNDDVLFFGYGTHGSGGVNHYRTIQPARTIGANYALHDGTRGISQHHVTQDDHKLHIIQNSMVTPHLSLIKQQMQTDAILCANVDDWVPAVRKQKDHLHYGAFQSKKAQNQFRQYLTMTTHCIVSTPWLQTKMRTEGYFPEENIHLCRNMIDQKRYPKPTWEQTDTVRIAWSGSTGHERALKSILPIIEELLNRHEHVEFHTHGVNIARLLNHKRAIGHSWTDIWQYPSQVAKNDIVIAPAISNDYYRAKSQLRLYEAAMLGLPVVAHPMYDESPHTLIAKTDEEWYTFLDGLIRDRESRVAVGKRQYEWALQEIVTDVRKAEWQAAVDAILAESA